MTSPDLEARLRGHIVDVPDFPAPGIVFKDLTPLLADAGALAAAVDGLAAVGRGFGALTHVAAIDARGFILGAPVALALGLGLVPLRKGGKLPRATVSATYDLEYGQATLEVHGDAFGEGARVLLVDDVLATGGTAAAAVDVIHRAGGQVAGCAFLIELVFLRGRARLGAVPSESLLSY